MKYVILYLFLEVMISSYFASIFGGFLTFIFIILSAIIGITLLRNFKYSLSKNIKDLTSAKISQEEFVKTNMAKALGAILLIIPGYFTDLLGILLQFGILTMLLTKIFKLKPQNINQNTYSSTYENVYSQDSINNSSYSKKENDEIIDVEVIDTNHDKH